MIRTLVLSSLVALSSCSAFAQTVLHFREGERVDPYQVRQILDNGSPMGRTRSIRLLQDEPHTPAGNAAPVAAAAAKTETSRTSALSLPVRFEFDSTSITAPARLQLDALAEGIKMLPAERSVVIEGHTDANGTDAYNQALSLRRALAVKQYLAQTHGIDAQRLQALGFGERRPIAGADPYAAANRRVQFHGG
jgi:outer membrane protein OmpA-like peptidoglycan-associated protein